MNRSPSAGMRPPESGKRPLKIAVISRSDRSGGGASRVAEQLADRLDAAEGVVAHHWMAEPAGNRHRGRRLYGSPGAWLLQKSCQWLADLVGLCDFLTPEALFFERRAKGIDYDLIHFHDISRSFSPIGMRRLARRRPVVWTFHDCSPFTGGCINPLGCTAFHSRCGRCPQLGRWPLKTWIDHTGFMQAYKRNTARLGLVTPIAPSTWIASEAVKAGFFDETPTVIPNAVDSAWFRPCDRREVRKSLHLNPDAFTVLVAAGHLGSPFKGTKYAVEAINRVDRPVQALFVGKPDDASIAACRSAHKHVAGSVEDDTLLARYYAAADVYLYPTVADNLPSTVLETMACETPTIGFRTGGMADMVEHEKTGFLVEQGDVDGLIAGLRMAADRPAIRRAWAAAGREKVIEEFSEERFLERHLRLYEQVIRKRESERLAATIHHRTAAA